MAQLSGATSADYTPTRLVPCSAKGDNRGSEALYAHASRKEGRVKVGTLVFSRHAVERMVSRRISTSEVHAIVESGVTVESYPSDLPFPSVLMLGSAYGQPIHVVVGYDESTETAYVVTTYESDPALWYPDWKTRRPR